MHPDSFPQKVGNFMPKFTAPPPKLTKDQGINIVVMVTAKSAAHHDAWMFDKEENTLYYVPFGHHYQLFDGLTQMKRKDLLGIINGKEDNHRMRFGDVKHGTPRTIKENELKKEPLRSTVIDLYNKSRAGVK